MTVLQDPAVGYTTLARVVRTYCPSGANKS